MVEALARLGDALVGFLAASGRVIGYTAGALRVTFTTREGISASIGQAGLLTWRCIVPVMLVAGPIGAMLAMQSLSVARAFGLDRLLPPLVSATIVRELAPGFAAVMVCFQAGAGIAAELGTMRVQEEIDALEVMGMDPRAFVVGPRVVGAAVATALLNALAIVTGILGAYLVAVPMAGMAHALFTDTAIEGLTLVDVWLSELKAGIFGLVLGAVSATFGAFAQGGPQGVGRAANRAVVATVILVLVTNYVVNTAIFGLKGGGVPL